MPELFQRARSIRVLDREDTTTIVCHDGSARQVQGDSARLVREILHALRTPQSVEGILAHLASIADGVETARSVVESVLQLLQDTGVVTPASSVASPPRHEGRLVLGISGAIAAAHTPALVDRLLSRGFEIRVALTPAARRFVRPEALRALTHHRVHRSVWAGTADAPTPHIDLAEWADVVLLAPATATTLSRIVRGDCSDLVSAVALSTRAPVIVAPSMNAAMHDAPAVARNLDQLVEDGFHVLHPSTGIEVADAPHARRPVFGSWPAPDDTVAMVEHVWRRFRQRSGGVLPASEVASTWDATWRDVPPEQLPFHTEQVEDDLREALERVTRPARLWDVGTGLGTVAREAARMGFSVVGTDISTFAIALASGRVPENVELLVDDVRRSRVAGTFDVVVDRGCLHTLEPTGAAAYVDAVRQRTHAGSLVLLKLHREDDPTDYRTMRYRVGDIERLFGPSFELIRWSASSLSGAAPTRAWLAVLERRLTA